MPFYDSTTEREDDHLGVFNETNHDNADDDDDDMHSFLGDIDVDVDVDDLHSSGRSRSKSPTAPTTTTHDEEDDDDEHRLHIHNMPHVPAYTSRRRHYNGHDGHDDGDDNDDRISGSDDSSDDDGNITDDDYSAAGSNSTNATQSNNNNNNNEARILSSAKLVVLVCLLSLAGGVSYIWYIFAQREQEDTFTREFEDYAQHMLQVFLERAHFNIQASVTLSTALTSAFLQQQQQQQWPFVSFDDFERRVASSRRLTQASSVWFSPFLIDRSTTSTDQQQQQQQRQAWEAYASQHTSFLQSNFQDPLIDFADTTDTTATTTTATTTDINIDWTVQQGIYRIQNNMPVSDQSSNAAPIWQSSPYSVTNSATMFNQMSNNYTKEALHIVRQQSAPIYSSSYFQQPQISTFLHPHVSIHAPIFDALPITSIVEQDTSPTGTTDTTDTTGTTIAPTTIYGNVVGALTFTIDWIQLLQHSIHGSLAPLYVVLENTCNQHYTYKVSDASVQFIQDTNDQPYQNQLDLLVQSEYSQFPSPPSSSSITPSTLCSYRLRIYPTQEYQDQFLTNQPTLSAIGVASIFILTAAVFIFYDCLVQKRQKRVMQFAKRSNAIVRSLFPAGVRDRLMQEGNNNNNNNNGKRGPAALPASYLPMETPKSRLKTYLNDDDPAANHSERRASDNASEFHQQQHNIASDPIADFWPNTSVLFADLSGFTAWSSTREPSQVFTLLETLYGAMDKAARRLGVFKVETVGDCYVAATGLPDPRDDHAILMVRFASVCLTRINELTSSLEAALGPGTGDLAMRMGVHSGPVTAGVLRGEKSRFQLFGDTMNTAAKLENSGTRNRVHLSKDTAELLTQGGKGHWLEKRADPIEILGKGTMQTFWLKAKLTTGNGEHSTRSGARSNTSGSDNGSSSQDQIVGASETDDTPRRMSNPSTWNEKDRLKRLDRLVEWNVEILSSVLRQIIARRSASKTVRKQGESINLQGKTVLEEVKEVIAMPAYDPRAAVKIATESSVQLPPSVRRELRDFIHCISTFYNDNPFHNFEHASHVTLSANKLLKRIVMPDDVDYRRDSEQEEIDKLLAVSADLHEVTYGISSDPVTQFAVVFSALIHDTGHTGVPNNQLAMEEPETAAQYKNTSIAEQRSVDVAWNQLMEPAYDNLRACLFPTQAEMTHFRQLIVNSVMATDIFDPHMTKLRKARWQKAFHPEEEILLSDSEDEVFNRKATIVIEHIIQASDVAHTMQHWHVYQKWNERLFQEMYAAYRDGRSDKDPSLGWYKGELWFFDNYVIPLAHKLKECGVFGVSSAEYLNYALQNREEWEAKGEKVCERMVGNFEESRFAKKKHVEGNGC